LQFFNESAAKAAFFLGDAFVLCALRRSLE